MTDAVSFRQTATDDTVIAAYSALLSSTFAGAGNRFTPDYLKWLYRDNPAGPVVGTDAYDGERLAAHYVCIPFDARMNGGDHRVLLSLNTATHPDYQGRGLFTKLARQTYARAAETGFSAVVGVANANSTPGFVNKLGFQLVTPLRAMIGLGSPVFDTARLGQHASAFTRTWNDTSLAWRLANPVNPIRMIRYQNGQGTFCAATDKPLIRAWSCRPVQAASAPVSPASPGDHFLHVFLGAFPPAAGSLPAYIDIPRLLRPVPLNFIYLALGGGLSETIDKERIYFDFLDFDAF